MEHVGVGAGQALGDRLRVAAQRDHVLVHLHDARIGGDLAPVQRVAVGEVAVLQHLLALEHEGDARAEEGHGGAQRAALAGPVVAGGARTDGARHALLAVGHLVVALHVDHALGVVAVVAVGDGFLDLPHVAAAVPGLLDHVAHVVHEPVPLAVEAGAAHAGGLADPVAVVEVLGHRDLARELRVDLVVAPLQHAPGVRQLLAVLVGAADVLGAVPPQTVHAELVQPHQRVVPDELAHFGAAVVRPRVAPRRRRLRGVVVEEDATKVVLAPAIELPHVHVGGAEVVVDHVVQHGDAARMRRIHESLQVIRRAVGALNAEGVAGVVAPAEVARELVDGHQADAVHAQIRQMVQLADRVGEGGRRRSAGRGAEGADVHLVDHQLVPVGDLEVRRLPLVRRGVIHDAGAHAVGQVARARIVLQSIRVVVLDRELVLRPGQHVGDVARPVPVALAAELVRGGAVEGAGQRHADGLRVGRPCAEGDALGGAHLIGDGADAAARGHGQHHGVSGDRGKAQRSEGGHALRQPGAAGSGRVRHGGSISHSGVRGGDPILPPDRPWGSKIGFDFTDSRNHPNPGPTTQAISDVPPAATAYLISPGRIRAFRPTRSGLDSPVKSA